MRARATLGGVFASIAILVTAWQLGTSATGQVTTVTVPGTTTNNGSSSGPTSDGTSSTPVTAAVADGTFTGAVVGTRFGDVQVAVTISGGTITDVTALHLTDRDGRSVQISNRAAPILRTEVLASQSASVANVGGATYTVRGYLSSLQSALDQAGF